jgi:hypothetical protein
MGMAAQNQIDVIMHQVAVMLGPVGQEDIVALPDILEDGHVLMDIPVYGYVVHPGNIDKISPDIKRARPASGNLNAFPHQQRKHLAQKLLFVVSGCKIDGSDPCKLARKIDGIGHIQFFLERPSHKVARYGDDIGLKLPDGKKKVLIIFSETLFMKVGQMRNFNRIRDLGAF